MNCFLGLPCYPCIQSMYSWICWQFLKSTVKIDIQDICSSLFLQMTRHFSVRCVSDSFLQTATSQSTKRNMETKNLPVRSAISCSTGRMSCWITRGDTWKVSTFGVNFLLEFELTAEVGIVGRCFHLDAGNHSKTRRMPHGS